MLKALWLSLIILVCVPSIGAGDIEGLKKGVYQSFSFHGKIMVELPQSETPLHFVRDERIYAEGWSELAQPIFWSSVMKLTLDSGIINIGSTREIIELVSIADWGDMSQEQKDDYRDSIKYEYCLEEEEHVYLTTGKAHFYDFERVMPSIDKAIRVFENDSVDPWFAQAILCIESPNTLQKSPKGAYGSFQLMKGVARRMGLKVNRYVDERKDFNKCAHGAAKLIRTICIPETNVILNNKNIPFDENDIWYKLLVLHVYHAGAYNVAKAVGCLEEDVRGIELIKALWHIECGGFKNASQNYSQVALASVLELERIIYETSIDVCPVVKY